MKKAKLTGKTSRKSDNTANNGTTRKAEGDIIDDEEKLQRVI